MGGRGARSELYDIMHDKPYGTEYTCVAKIGNCKILRYGDGKQSKAPVETRTRGRIYAIINKNGDIACIVFYDKKKQKVSTNRCKWQTPYGQWDPCNTPCSCWLLAR